MSDSADIQSIVIIGRIWGPSLNGNTYSAATIVVNGEEVGHVAPQYGTGYVHEAFRWLDEHGHTARKTAPAWFVAATLESPGVYCRRHGIALHYEACRVGRKKDLA